LSTEPKSLYSARIRDCVRSLDGQKNIEAVLIAAKLGLIACGIFFLYRIAAANQNRDLLLFGAVLAVFAIPAIVHEHYLRKRSFICLLKELNEMEIRALEHEFLDYDDGHVFVDPDHGFSSDLDLFGPKSVFHFLNRTTTSLGKGSLSDWLRAAPESRTPETIRARQQAVQELTDMVDLRQRVQAHGRGIGATRQQPQAFPLLMEEPDLVSRNRWMLWLIHGLPLCTLAAAGLIFTGLHWGIALGLLLIQSLLNRRTKKARQRFHLLTSHNAAVFKAYSRIILEIENARFETPLLRDMQAGLRASGRHASRSIRALSTLAAFFEVRRSEILHPVLNSVILWDLHCVFHLERWKSRYGGRALAWLQTLGEFETLSSFANALVNFPLWTFPEIVTTPGLFQAESLGHFFSPPEERVCNDVRTEGSNGNILIVTGPNMAGKSTFLKTLGVNTALALAGAPVCARMCRLFPFKLHTSMKVSDSLDQHLSLFYAELQRLKKILDEIVRGEDVLYLLDEMLKGTNALDRQAGALALLRQLAGYRALGVVATHDLELTRLEEELPDKIRNYHFDGHVEEERLVFDFRLKPGRCESFNALALMRKIGIEI
jgi:DNA mismatch repair ATPase MutS